MERDELIAAARHAASIQGLYADTERAAPQVIDGPAATSVIMAQLGGEWMVCIHPRGYGRDWYITGDINTGAVRATAEHYAREGV